MADTEWPACDGRHVRRRPGLHGWVEEPQRYCSEHGVLVGRRPAATPDTDAGYHAGARWHLCHSCGFSYLCHDRHAHGHLDCQERRRL